MNFKQAKGISVKDFLKRQHQEVYAAEAYGDFNNQLGHQPFKPTAGIIIYTIFFWFDSKVRRYIDRLEVRYEIDYNI